MLRPLRLDQPTAGTMRLRAVLSTVGIGVQGGLRFVSSVLIGRVGGDAVLGVVNSAISAAMFLTLLGPQSAGNAASKFVARSRGAGRYVEAQQVARHLAGRLVIVSAALAVIAILSWAGISGEPLTESWRGGLCVAALVVGYAGYSFVRGLQFGAGQVPRATAWDVTSVVIGLAGVLVLLASGVRNTTLLLPLAAAYLVYTAAGWPQRTATGQEDRHPGHTSHITGGSSSPGGAESGDGPRSGSSSSPDTPGSGAENGIEAAHVAWSSASKAPSAAAGVGAEEAKMASSDDPAASTSAGARAATLAGTDRGLGRGLRREIDHFVLFGIAGAVAVTGFLQISMVVARLADTDGEAGQYAAALSLATPASLLAGSMSLVLFPAMAEAWGRGDREGFRRQGDHAMRLLVLLMVAVFGALVLVSRPLVRVVYGVDYAHASDLLPWLLFAVLAISVGVGAVTSLTTRSQRGVALSSAASAVGLVVGGIVWAVLAPGEGVRGVAMGYLIGTVVGTAVPVVLVWRQDRQRWAGLMLRAAAGIALLLGLLWLEHRLGFSPFGDTGSSVVQGSSGSAAYSSTFTMTFDSSRVSAWWLDPLCAIGFVVAWLAISWPDTRRLLPPLLRRR